MAIENCFITGDNAMKKSTLNLIVIFATGLFLLACSLLPIPSTTVNISPTFTPLPELPPEQPTETSMGLENENLLVEIPSGFKIDHHAEQNNVVISELVSKSESVNDWTTLVTVHIFLGLTNTTPEQYQENMTQAWFDACADSETYPVADGDENGYHFVLWQLYCPLNPSTQKVEYTYMKAIDGKDSFYLVQVAFRHEPSNDEITQWMQYLKGVQVCDSRIPDRACP
jgi:hypothetical protein